MLPSWSPSLLEPRVHPGTAWGHLQQRVPTGLGPGLPRDGAQVENCLEGVGEAGCCFLGTLPPSGLRLPGQRTQAQGTQHPGKWTAPPAPVAKEHRSSQIAASLLPGPLRAFWRWSRQMGPWASLLWLVLTGPLRPARHSEACPGGGRGGVLLGADVESSHQPHKSRALFCLKPPKVPAASPAQPRPRPTPWARLVCTSPLSAPALQPHRCPTARNCVTATADPGLSQS